MKDEKLSKSGGAFFAAGSTTATGDWTELRDRWEWSHVARAALAVASLVALVVRDGDQAGVNIGSGGPPSVGLKTTFTGCSHFSLSRSQSTMLVTMRGPSASVT